jgi:type III secretion protein S
MNYDVIYIAKQGLLLSFILSMPFIITSSVVGLMFSLFQALVQIQDQSLSFAVKLFCVIISIYLTIDWTASKLYNYSLMLYHLIK